MSQSNGLVVDGELPDGGDTRNHRPINRRPPATETEETDADATSVIREQHARSALDPTECGRILHKTATEIRNHGGGLAERGRERSVGRSARREYLCIEYRSSRLLCGVTDQYEGETDSDPELATRIRKNHSR